MKYMKCPECAGRMEQRVATVRAPGRVYDESKLPLVPTCVKCGEQWYDATASAAVDAAAQPERGATDPLNVTLPGIDVKRMVRGATERACATCRGHRGIWNAEVVGGQKFWRQCPDCGGTGVAR